MRCRRARLRRTADIRRPAPIDRDQSAADGTAEHPDLLSQPRLKWSWSLVRSKDRNQSILLKNSPGSLELARRLHVPRHRWRYAS